MCGASDTAHLSQRETPNPVADPPRYSYTPVMPSQLTRVNLTLPDELIDALDRMGKVTGAGRATIIRELLIEGLPGLVSMADALEMAAKQNVDAFKVIADVMRDVAHEAGQMELDIRKKRRAAMRKRAK